MTRNLSFEQINPCLRSAGSQEAQKGQGNYRKIYDYELIYCHQGKMLINYEERTVCLHPGDLHLIQPGIPHKLDTRHLIEAYWLHFDFYYHNDQDDMQRYINLSKTQAFSPLGYKKIWSRSHIWINHKELPDTYRTKQMSATKDHYMKLSRLYQKRPALWALYSKQHILQLLAETFTHLTFNHHTQEGYLSPLVIQFINDHYHRKIRMDELASNFHYHKDTLNRIVKEETGLSIGSHIKKIRIDKSKALLTDTRMTLDEIASTCGFSDRSHYIKVFKELCQVTPGGYRQGQARKRFL